ncbi:MAG: preprotein translocase subunit SecG, partial [Steroidobacteraceae bacterium]
GATGSANFMSRSTAVCAAVFFVCTLSLAFFSNSETMRAPTEGSSVLDRAAAPASAPQAGASAVLPGSVPAGLPAPMTAAPATAAASAATK